MYKKNKYTIKDILVHAVHVIADVFFFRTKNKLNECRLDFREVNVSIDNEAQKKKHSFIDRI